MAQNSWLGFVVSTHITPCLFFSELIPNAVVVIWYRRDICLGFMLHLDKILTPVDRSRCLLDNIHLLLYTNRSVASPSEKTNRMAVLLYKIQLALRSPSPDYLPASVWTVWTDLQALWEWFHSIDSRTRSTCWGWKANPAPKECWNGADCCSDRGESNW